MKNKTFSARMRAHARVTTKGVVEGVNSCLKMAGKEPNDNLGEKIYAILFIVIALGIIATAIYAIVQLAYATIFRSAPAPNSQMVFNNSTVTVDVNTTSTSQTTATNITSSLVSSSEPNIVMRPPFINGATPPPIISGETDQDNQKEPDGYHTTFLLLMGVAAGTGAPIINSYTPPSIISSCKFVGSPQPGVAINGNMQYRIVYFFQYDCVSKEPIATGMPISFELNYSWQSLTIGSSTESK